MRHLALLAAAVLAAAPTAAQDSFDAARAQAEAERSRREADRAVAEAQARAAADAARVAREDADRRAAEARYRAEGDARAAALAAEYARRRSAAEAEAQAARAEADLARRAAETRARAAEAELRRLETTPPRPAISTTPVQPSTTAPRRRLPPVPTAAPATAIDMKEGVALCQPVRGREWRCTGPLRVATGDLDTNLAAVTDACGAAPVRRLGTVRGLRAFGCGYGVNPRSTAPGSRDVAALFGVEVKGRIIFRCPPTTLAYCRSR